MEQLYDHLIFVIHQWTFEKNPLMNFLYTTDSQKHYRDGGRALLGCKPDNQTTQALQIMSGSGLFTFHVYCAQYKGKPKCWEIYIWDVTGCTTIYSVKFPVIEENTDKIPKEEFDKMIEVLKDYSNGYIRCTKCHTRIKISDIAGSYFAGRYCDHCWNKGGMKEKEAQENYD